MKTTKRILLAVATTLGFAAAAAAPAFAGMALNHTEQLSQ